MPRLLLAFAAILWGACTPTSPRIPLETHEFDHLPPCEARTDARADPESLASLTATRYAVADFPHIHLLDGRPYVMSYFGFDGLSCNHRITRIEPGPHSIHVVWRTGRGYSYMRGGTRGGLSLATRLEFDARPGHTYALVIERTSSAAAAHLRHMCRIIDRTTEQVVTADEDSCGYPETYEVFDEIWAAYGACGDETGITALEADGVEPDPEARRESWFRATRGGGCPLHPVSR